MGENAHTMLNYTRGASPHLVVALVLGAGGGGLKLLLAAAHLSLGGVGGIPAGPLFGHLTVTVGGDSGSRGKTRRCGIVVSMCVQGGRTTLVSHNIFRWPFPAHSIPTGAHVLLDGTSSCTHTPTSTATSSAMNRLTLVPWSSTRMVPASERWSITGCTTVRTPVLWCTSSSCAQASCSVGSVCVHASEDRVCGRENVSQNNNCRKSIALSEHKH
jgi:hypothetical protein